jgi:hypothetical protein
VGLLQLSDLANKPWHCHRMQQIISKKRDQLAAAVQRVEVRGMPCERKLRLTVYASVAALFKRWDKKHDELVLKCDKLTLDADDNAP